MKNIPSSLRKLTKLPFWLYLLFGAALGLIIQHFNEMSWWKNFILGAASGWLSDFVWMASRIEKQERENRLKADTIKLTVTKSGVEFHGHVKNQMDLGLLASQLITNGGQSNPPITGSTSGPSA